MLPAGKYRWTSAFTWPAGGYVNAPSQSGSAVAAAGAISLRTNSQTNLICRVSGVDGRRINAKALLATVNSGDMAVKVAVSDLITGTVLDTDWVRESALGYRIITTGALPFVLRAGHVFEVQLFASGNPRVWKGSVLDIEG